jgi:uncharacterized hydrophobic protein (TIGR00271 family)
MEGPETLQAKTHWESAWQRARAFVRLVFSRARRLILMRLPAEEAASVSQHIDEEGALTERFALMCALSAGIATLGLLQSSSAVVIGAMLVSPLLGPIAALGLGLASLEGVRILRAARALGVGVAVGVFVGMTITWLSPIRNATPEILARTAPTLLDLAIALLSGLAGGYATVHRRGETAIGVAIATALMPPLATLGYALAVARFDFAFGALILFLTNLAAIAFAFVLVTRLRGVARPFRHVRITWQLVLASASALLLLVTPLALTLRRVSREAVALSVARSELASVFPGAAISVAQLSASWPNTGPLRIDAIIVSGAFVDEARQELQHHLSRRLSAPVELNLQQVVAANTRAETQSMIEAALRQPQSEAPPIESLRMAARVPTIAAWVDGSARTIFLTAAPIPLLDLAAVQAEERRLSASRPDWRVALAPPFRDRIAISFADDATTLSDSTQTDVALWALRRWNVTRVRVEGLSGRNTGANAASRTLATGRAAEVARRLRAAGFEVEETVAASALSRELYASGGVARVRAADILPLPSAPG